MEDKEEVKNIEINEVPEEPETKVEESEVKAEEPETKVEEPEKKAEEPEVKAEKSEKKPEIEIPKSEEKKAPKEKKKGGKGKVVGCIIGAVAVLGGGGFGVAYALTSSPEKVALYAISDFLSTKSLGINGVIEVYSNSSLSQNPFKSVKLELKSEQKDSKDFNTNATISVNFNNKEYSVSLGAVVVQDYTIYVKVSSLKEAAKQIIKELVAGNSSYSTYTELYEDLADKVAGEIDGIWWKLSVPELIDEADIVSSSDKEKAKDAYKCLIDAAKKSSEKDYAKIYKDNAFVKLEAHSGDEKFSGKGTAYDVTIDADKFMNFADAMTNEVDGLGLKDCTKKLNDINGVSSKYTTQKLEKDDIEKVIEKMPKMVVTIDGFLFMRSLTGFYTTFGSDASYSGKIDLTFNKNVNKIEAPSDAKPVTDLYKNVVKAYEDWQDTATCKALKKQNIAVYNTYCDSTTNKIKPQYKSYF